ncbi:MAG: hypothetical protein QOI07_940 [Verrucomicrobiota bacterium]
MRFTQIETRFSAGVETGLRDNEKPNTSSLPLRRGRKPRVRHANLFNPERLLFSPALTYHSGSVIAREFSDQQKARGFDDFTTGEGGISNRWRVKVTEMNEATHSASLQKAVTEDEKRMLGSKTQRVGGLEARSLVQRGKVVAFTKTQHDRNTSELGVEDKASSLLEPIRRQKSPRGWLREVVKTGSPRRTIPGCNSFQKSATARPTEREIRPREGKITQGQNASHLLCLWLEGGHSPSHRSASERRHQLQEEHRFAVRSLPCGDSSLVAT